MTQSSLIMITHIVGQVINFLGLVYTAVKVSRNWQYMRFTNRDFVICLMYLTFSLGIVFAFIRDYSLFVTHEVVLQNHDFVIYLLSRLNWDLFILLAILWSSGFHFEFKRYFK